ncbi:MAG: SDR family NAD(P)-dependent oxidoreductase [Acidimicrobiales bacterium]
MRTQDLIDLTGKRAVVTGAGAGIGAAIAAHLAGAGATVLVTDLDAVAAEATASSLRAAGASASAMRCNVTVTDELVAAAEAGAGDDGVDIWVNNAGIYPTTGPLAGVTDEFVARMLDVNVRAQYSATREAVRRMPRGGAIVNLASIAGLRGGAGISAYSTSKAAVIGMTRALAAELGPAGVRINAVAPGVIDTPGVQAQLGPLKDQGIEIERIIAGNPLRIGGRPDHIARVTLFLVSPLAEFVTGQTIVADGGATL